LARLCAGTSNLIVFAFVAGRRRLLALDLGLVEEQVLLVRRPGLAPGGEQLTLEVVELLLQQVALGAHNPQRAHGLSQRLRAYGPSARIVLAASRLRTPDHRIGP
jgi:hypothetical protein